MNLSTSQQRALLSLASFAAVILLINVAAEFMVQVWPLKFGELTWRVGSTGLIMESLVKALPGLVLLYFVAALSDARKLMRFYSIVGLVVGIAVLGLLVFFALDTVQLRASVPQQTKSLLTKVALRAGLVGTLSAALLIWAGVAVNKVLKSAGVVSRSGARQADSGNDDGLLMIGRPAAPARPNLTAVKGDEPVKVVEA
ncbi:MAG: hypothetical protein MUF21_08930 [Gemmatimonadaceae bacterium]|nr:hypothetical protein [Gemmatimonadaceae bacterium]